MINLVKTAENDIKTAKINNKTAEKRSTPRKYVNSCTPKIMLELPNNVIITKNDVKNNKLRQTFIKDMKIL